MVEVRMGFFGDGNGNGEGRIIGDHPKAAVFEDSKAENVKPSIESENKTEKNRELIEKSFKEIFSKENNESVRIFSQKKNKVTTIGTHLVIGSYDIGSITRLKQLFLDKYKNVSDLNEDEIKEKVKDFCLENLDAVSPTVDMRRAIRAVFGEDDSMGNPYSDESKEYESKTTLSGAKHLGSAAAVNGGTGKKNEARKLLEGYMAELLSHSNKKLKKLEEADKEIIKEYFDKFLSSKEALTIDTKKAFVDIVKPYFLDTLDALGLSAKGITYVENVFKDKKGSVDIYSEDEWAEFLSDEKNKDWKETFEKAKGRIDDLSQTPDEYRKDHPEHKLSNSFPFDLRLKLDEYLQLEVNRNIELDDAQKDLWRRVLGASRNICADNPMKFVVYDNETLGITDKKAVDSQEVKKNTKVVDAEPVENVENKEEEAETEIYAVEKLFLEAGEKVEYVDELEGEESDMIPFVHLDIKEYFKQVLEFTKENHDRFTDAERDGMRRVVAMAKQILIEQDEFEYFVIAGQTYKMPKRKLFSKDSDEEKESKKATENQEEKKTEFKFVAKTTGKTNGGEAKKEVVERSKEKTPEELFESVKEKSKGVFTLELCQQWKDGYVKDAVGDVEGALRADVEWSLNRIGEKGGKDFEKVVQYILENVK